MENFSLERAAAERRLEAAFLLILPNEFGEIRPDLWRLVQMFDYIRHPILKIGKFLGRQAAKTCQSSELDDGYSFLSAYPFMNRRKILNVVTNYSCIIIKSLIRSFNLIM